MDQNWLLNLDQNWPLNLDQSGPAWSWFDHAQYAQHDSTAAKAAQAGAPEALDDYLQRGAALGYAPNLFFQPAFYRSANPDIASLIGSDEYPTFYDHYRREGWFNRDPHWLFSVALYQRTSPDLAPDVVAHLGGLYGHFLRAGAREGRMAHQLFDPNWYSAHQQDSKASEQPFSHFLTALWRSAATGAPEPRSSPYFDPVWYLATYPDPARAVAAGQFQGALHHYITDGADQGLDPLCDFSEMDYRRANPDVDEAIKNGVFRNGYSHFLAFGAVHGRSPCDHVDLGWYAAQPAVAGDLSAGSHPNAFLHMLEKGIPKGLPLQPPGPLNFTLREADARAVFVAQANRALASFGRRPLDFTCQGEPAVSVIVILRNQYALTMQALASLRHTYSASIQLIIVDNASSDGTTHIADVVLGAQIVRLEENVGFLLACNLALRSTVGPAVLYLNNDVILHVDAVKVALDRLGSDPRIGAVGGKIIRTHGVLQEAGCLVWRDGNADGWMRGALPDVPEANYARDVDYCSGAFLMVRGDLLRMLGGFDEAFAPAYYEETDLCLRIQAAGYRILYDPAIGLTHYEYGSSRGLRAATALMLANRSKLRSRHAAALRSRTGDRSRMAEAAAFASRGRRVLFLEDTIPLRRLGSGYGRAGDVINAMAALGWQVSVVPMHPIRTPLHQITAGLADTVETLWTHDHRTLRSLLNERAGYYDAVWISRAHNLRQFLDSVGRELAGLESACLILDTEAVFSMRDASRAELEGLPFDLHRSLSREFEDAWMCDHVVAVNEAEAEVLRSVPLSSVGVIGFWQTAHSIGRRWSERSGLLHVGALTVSSAPNVDGLRWFLRDIHPRLTDLVGREAAHLTIVGHVAEGFDISWLSNDPAITFVGSATDLTPFYDASRVFIAPTRFGAGVPTKVLDAVSHGVPVVGTALLAGQLGWNDGTEMSSAALNDPDGFANRIARLITDEACWTVQQASGLETIKMNYDADYFKAQVQLALAHGSKARRRGADPHAPALQSVGDS